MNKDLTNSENIKIGIISDTHGQLGRKARSTLSRADVIIHAGDFDNPGILSALGELAPVIAVRGNMDCGNWADRLPATDMVELGGRYIYVLHNLRMLDIDPETAGIKIVVSGHTHQAAAVQTNGVLFLNPGSPTSPRYGSDASVAMLKIRRGEIRYRFIEVA